MARRGRLHGRGSATSSGCSPTRASSTWASSSSASASAAPASSARCSTSVNNGLTKGVLFLSAGNIHRAYGSKTHRRRRAARSAACRSPGALFLAGFLADHRLAAVRPVRQRVHDPERRRSTAGTSSSAALFLVLLGDRLHRHGRDRPRRRPGRGPRTRRGRTAFRDDLCTVAARSSSLLALVAAAGPLHSRRRSERSCARPRRSWRRGR